MRLKVEELGQGLHPSEAVVSIPTVQGPQELVVNRQAIRHSALEVGYPVAVMGDRYLVELPAETNDGASRVWVKQENLQGEALEAAE